MNLPHNITTLRSYLSDRPFLILNHPGGMPAVPEPKRFFRRKHRMPEASAWSFLNSKGMATYITVSAKATTFCADGFEVRAKMHPNLPAMRYQYLQGRLYVAGDLVVFANKPEHAEAWLADRGFIGGLTTTLPDNYSDQVDAAFDEAGNLIEG